MAKYNEKEKEKIIKGVKETAKKLGFLKNKEKKDK